MRTLEIYEERTAHLRDNRKEMDSQLIISFKKPHGPVKPASISRWIKETLLDARVDVGIFKGHSIRAASSSAACTKGVSVSDIMAMAGWSRSSTFEKFYHKQIKSDFSDAVLKS